MSKKSTNLLPPDDPASNNDYEAELENIRVLARKIQAAGVNANPTDLKAVRAALVKHPEVCERLGNMATHTRERLITEMIKTDTFGNELLQAEIELMYRGLGYEAAPELERLVIHQIINSYILQNSQENRYAGMLGAGDMSIEQARFMEYRLAIGQKRFLRAVETLARVRKLAGLGGLQINIGGQQLNVSK
jgi:hypothetical protein